MAPWYYDPQSGGVKIPPKSHSMIVLQAEAYAKAQPWFTKFQLKLRFKNQFCYLDACEAGQSPFPIGRLRYFRDNAWSLAFFAYSSMSYQPCVLNSGKMVGTLEEGIAACEMYLI
jgi:hypothetical protein